MTLFLKHPMALFLNGTRESIFDGLLKKLEDVGSMFSETSANATCWFVHYKY